MAIPQGVERIRGADCKAEGTFAFQSCCFYRLIPGQTSIYGLLQSKGD